MKNNRFPNLEDTNPNNWKGVFYVNKKDKRLIVPKKAPAFGWTLNFGNPYAYVLVLFFLGTLVAYALFS